MIPEPIIAKKGRWYIAEGFPGAKSKGNEAGFTHKRLAMEHMLFFSIKQQDLRTGKVKPDW